MIDTAAMTLSRRIGRLTLVAALAALAACAAIDDGTDVPGDDEIEEMEEMAGMEETDRALASGDEEVAGAEPGLAKEVAAARYWVGDGACHTFDFLRYWSNLSCAQNVYCGNGWSAHAVDRNYTHGCEGWWGRGARYVWFSCSCAIPA
jgi:hypothetical protein